MALIAGTYAVNDAIAFSSKLRPSTGFSGKISSPFSIAGVSSKKHMGRAHGFDARTTPSKKNPLGETQGTLFFDIARIIKEKRPAAFLLEDVKNLKGHDKGNTFRVILKVLKEELGYDVHYKVVDASSVVQFGVTNPFCMARAASISSEATMISTLPANG